MKGKMSAGETSLSTHKQREAESKRPRRVLGCGGPALGTLMLCSPLGELVLAGCDVSTSQAVCVRLSVPGGSCLASGGVTGQVSHRGSPNLSLVVRALTVPPPIPIRSPAPSSPTPSLIPEESRELGSGSRWC